ncbi:MAG: choice-of-anchor L domain-containing protein [Bacteroidota bacterium]
MKFRILLGIILLASVNKLNAQVSVDTTMPIEDLVNEVLLGEGMIATNITYNGIPAAGLINPAIGSFLIENSAFPLSQGVAMATGFISEIGSNEGVGFGNSGISNDPDLVSISGQNVNDCAILEFDFVATTDTFLIDFVFSSHEYPQFTCNNVNDAFGIFISGPGIDGPFSGGAENIALIPNSNVPVSINTINGGAPSGGSNEDNCLNVNPNYVEDAIYFINNFPQPENGISIPGHTHRFTAFTQLMVGESYHFKFGIGDAIDAFFDSYVFMRRGSASDGIDLNETTFDVSTEGINVDPEGIFISGNFNYFVSEPMTQISENIYQFTTELPEYVNVTYKFFNGSGPNSSEVIVGDCGILGYMPDVNRHFVTNGQDIILDPVCFGTCEVCNEILSTEDEAEESLGVFPNPSQGQLQIVAPNDGFARVQVFNILGSMVYDERVFLNAGTNFEFELEERGLYKVNLSFDGNTGGYSSTVIVE